MSIVTFGGKDETYEGSILEDLEATAVKADSIGMGWVFRETKQGIEEGRYQDEVDANDPAKAVRTAGRVLALNVITDILHSKPRNIEFSAIVRGTKNPLYVPGFPAEGVSRFHVECVAMGMATMFQWRPWHPVVGGVLAYFDAVRAFDVRNGGFGARGAIRVDMAWREPGMPPQYERESFPVEMFLAKREVAHQTVGELPDTWTHRLLRNIFDLNDWSRDRHEEFRTPKPEEA